ncbi:MAG: hypothetical protein JWM85_3389 [Acidimicrobiaceae bacterium]|nr:hypothetical protein [Acidimicrobiaceae bacterium]
MRGSVVSIIASVHGGFPPWLNVLLMVAAVAFVLFRRIRGEPLLAKRVLILPVILTIAGIVNLTKVHGVTGKDIVFVVVGGIIALSLGTARGASIERFEKSGYLWQRYRKPTIVLWTVLVAVRVILAGIAHVAHAPLAAGSQTLLFGLGLSLTGEALIVGSRALSSGAPFAPDPGRPGSGIRQSALSGILERLSAQSSVTSLTDPDDLGTGAARRSDQRTGSIDGLEANPQRALFQPAASDTANPNPSGRETRSLMSPSWRDGVSWVLQRLMENTQDDRARHRHRSR